MKFIPSYPDPQLQSLVKRYHYVAQDAEDIFHGGNILPSLGCHMTIILDGQFEFIIEDKVIAAPLATLSGQFDRTYLYQTPLPYECIVISFKSTAFYQLFGINMRELTNTHCSITKYMQEVEIEPWLAKIKSTENLSTRFSLVNDFLLTIEKQKKNDTATVDRCIEQMVLHSGTQTVQDLALQLGVSKRYLEIQFGRMVGLSPGRLNRLLRFYCILQEWITNGEGLTSLFDKYSYFDYSHFRKDFMSFFSMTPADFDIENNLLIVKQLVHKLDFSEV